MRVGSTPSGSTRLFFLYRAQAFGLLRRRAPQRMPLSNGRAGVPPGYKVETREAGAFIELAERRRKPTRCCFEDGFPVIPCRKNRAFFSAFALPRVGVLLESLPLS